MLEIVVKGSNDLWDEVHEKFISNDKEVVLHLEHSLIAISKWEAKYHKTFLSKKNKKSEQELMDYVRFMTLDENVDDSVYYSMTSHNIKEINDYMTNTMTATKIPKSDADSSEPLTSELIYFYMIELGIPFECQSWHINRLLQLINVCAFKKEKPKKMSRTDIFKRNSEINKRNQELLRKEKEKRNER